MMIKRIALPFFTALLAWGVTACQELKYEVETTPSPAGELFYATIEGNDDCDTRVYADEQLRVLWDADDRVSIFNRTSANLQYRFMGHTGDNAGEFAPVPQDDPASTTTIPHIVAVYPYDEFALVKKDRIEWLEHFNDHGYEGTYWASENRDGVYIRYPSAQTYRENSFGLHANRMVSFTDDNHLMFKNTCGYLVLRLTGNASVQSVSIRGKNREILAGSAFVAEKEGELFISMKSSPAYPAPSDYPYSVTLTAESEVALSPSTPTEFWFALPPVTFETGFVVTVRGTQGDYCSLTTRNKVEIKRNHVARMAPVDVEMTPMESDIISFADPNVKARLVEGFDQNGDGEISYAEAAQVTNDRFRGYFAFNMDYSSMYAPYVRYTSFDELQYFTGLTEIPSDCFNGAGLKSITIPSTVTAIGYNALAGNSFERLDFPESVKVFDCCGLRSCNGTLIFRSPDYIDLHWTSFAEYGGYCEADEIIMYAVNPPDVGMHYQGVANGNGLSFSGSRILVPAVAVNAYKEVWHHFVNKIQAIPGTEAEPIVFENSAVKAKLTGAFDTDQDGELSYTEASLVTNEQMQGFFEGFTGNNSPFTFDEFEFFTGLTTVPERCFAGCSSMTSIKVPPTVLSLGESAFEGCSGLDSLVFSHNMVSLGASSLKGCSSLEALVFYAYGLQMSDHPFGSPCEGLTSLKSLTLYNRVPPTLEDGVISIPADCIIYVSDPEAYASAQVWSNYAGQYQYIPDYEYYLHTHLW